MTLLDILQVILSTVLILAVILYATRRELPAFGRRLRHRLLPPRYLKQQGIWQRDSSSSQAKK